MNSRGGIAITPLPPGQRQLKRLGLVAHNVAEHVDRVNRPHKVVEMYTEGEVRQLLAALADDRLGTRGSWRCPGCAGVRSPGCGGPTLMHLRGVPVAVISAWIGHKDASLTMKLVYLKGLKVRPTKY